MKIWTYKTGDSMTPIVRAFCLFNNSTSFGLLSLALALTTNNTSLKYYPNTSPFSFSVCLFVEQNLKPQKANDAREQLLGNLPPSEYVTRANRI